MRGGTLEARVSPRARGPLPVEWRCRGGAVEGLALYVGGVIMVVVVVVAICFASVDGGGGGCC